jgi:hypothetical protein
MSTSWGTSNFKQPWAWLVALVVYALVLALSTALYVAQPAVKLPLPWWAAVVAPVLVYALVLPLCVPRIRMRGWAAGLFALVVLHVGIVLATAWLYATVTFTSFEQALTAALWGFPPALVLAMIGSLVMTLPFLAALAPRAAAPRFQAKAVAPGQGSAKKPRQAPPRAIPAPAVIEGKDRNAWARGPVGAESAAAASTAVVQAASAPPAAAVAAPVLEEPLPVAVRHPVPATDEPVEHAVPLVGIIGAVPDMAEAEAPAVESSAIESATVEVGDVAPAAIPDFRQALSELLGAPVVEAGVNEASEPPDDRVVEEPSFTAAAADAPMGIDAPVGMEPVLRIPFERVVGQLPPGAFRVPLEQVGARLREPEMLVVPQAVIEPQLGEGVVQVEWELVAEQFPAAVFAVAAAEVKERIVNGRLLLPLDEIVRQLPPDVFAASLGRGPAEVPGIESFPAPFQPWGWAESSPEPTVAPAASVTVPAPPTLPDVVPEPEPAPDEVPEPVAVEQPVHARAIEASPVAEPAPERLEWRGDAEKIAALLAPWDTATLDEVQIGDFAIISVSAAGVSGRSVAAVAGRLSPLIARRAPRPVDQATLRGVGGTLVLMPVGPGWSTGRALAVGVRPGGALARVEMLARGASAAHDPASLAAQPHEATPAVRFDSAPPPATAAAAAEDLEAFGPLQAWSYREPTTGTLIHCFVSPGTSAAELAPFAWELSQAMAQGAQAGALGPFHSAVLRSGGARLEIRRLPSASGPGPVLVVGGADSGRPGLERLQVERAAARLGVA